MKVLPSQIMTIDFTDPSSIAALTPLFNPSLTFADKAFTGGEFRVITATSPLISKLVTSFMVGIFCSLIFNRSSMLA